MNFDWYPNNIPSWEAMMRIGFGEAMHEMHLSVIRNAMAVKNRRAKTPKLTLVVSNDDVIQTHAG